jgi:hypothetical protein
MPVESLPQISLGTAALIIFLICVAFVFLRGVTRMLFGALVLGGSVWVGFMVWQKAPGWAIELTGKPMTWISTGLPIVAAIATFIFARIVIGFFLKPFRRSGDGSSSSPMGILVRLALAVIPTAFLWLIGATLVHHFGSIAEVTAAAEGGKKSTQTPLASQFLELKDAIAAIIPADWLKKLDPLTDPSHLLLAKLMAAQPESGLKPVIDPETGKPYPRAIIVDAPELQTLADDGSFSTLIRHPLFQKALHDPKVQKALGEARR